MTVRGIYLSSKRTNVCNQLSSFLKWEEGVHQYNSIIEQIQCVCVYVEKNTDTCVSLEPVCVVLVFTHLSF